ncbi:phosphoglycerate mutase family protein [Tasmannia lanceolata]|uniref:phosphoglycerate mutase family protein n=1 Tax=Tasmannia lanceolata TaxID=3420 RepID=UPI00406403D7
MGSAQSSQEREGEEEEEQEENGTERNGEPEKSFKKKKKVLEQEPEILPCHASASPLSPQLSSIGTPRLGPSIKVWDPYNVLSPQGVFSRNFSSDALDDDRTVEVFLINHGECGVSVRQDLIGGRWPDLVAGRWPAAGLTVIGKRQARALAVFLKSQGVRFDAVYSSPLDRARETAGSVCQELNFSEEQIQSSDALIEMSQGQWEGCLRSEIYTPDIISLIDRSQPDFSPPSGESLRQVEFRMIEFLNTLVLRIREKQRTVNSSLFQNETKGFSPNSQILSNSIQDRDGSAHPQWDLLHRHRQGLLRKKSGKSRLQFVTMGDNEAEEEFSPTETNHGHLREVNGQSYSVGIFTHEIPIKCIITALLGCSPAMSHRICIDESSTTVLRHSVRTGWQIKRLNDTAHLRLL